MNAPARRPPQPASRWLPAVAAAALLGTVVLAGVAGGGGGDDAAVVESSLVETVPPVSADQVSETVETLPPAETTEPPPVETRPEAEKIPLDRTLADGVAGDDVRRVQERLTELGFQPGGTDGIYGPLTIQSVWAFEKLVLGTPRDQVTGRVTPEMWYRMQDHVKITPRRPEPGTRNHTEVYLPEQVVAIFHDGVAVFVAHISSGTNEEWCREVTISPGEFGNEDGDEPKKEGRCGISRTPGGVFTVHRKVEGHRQSALGGMLNPVYFNYGIAIHGAHNVPTRPASHGCIRIPNALSDMVFEKMGMGDRVFVWDGVKEPEAYGAQPPVFDWRWAEYYETTTTTTTSTTTTTTVAPTTTEATSTTSSTPESTTTEAPDTTTTTTTTSTPPTTTDASTPTTTTTSSPPPDADGDDEDDES